MASPHASCQRDLAKLALRLDAMAGDDRLRARCHLLTALFVRGDRASIFVLVATGSLERKNLTARRPSPHASAQEGNTMTKPLPAGINLALLAGCGPPYADGSGGCEPAGGIETTTRALATLAVASIFGSNMVLQRNTTVPVFGTADPGVAVTVDFQGQGATTVADSAGQGSASLAAMPTSVSPDPRMATAGETSAIGENVQVGEVWLCSGQSNMGKPSGNADGSAPCIADAENHNLRLFRMVNGSAPATASWQISDSTTATTFSPVHYFRHVRGRGLLRGCRRRQRPHLALDAYNYLNTSFWDSQYGGQSLTASDKSKTTTTDAHS
jgi:hypothetical protein